MRIATVLKVAARVVESRLRSAFGFAPRPYKALLELSYLCNSRCVNCDIWRTGPASRDTQLTVEEIDAFLQEAGPDLTWLSLSGGEITLYRELPAVIAAITRNCPSLSLLTFTTNGLLPTRALECASQLRATGADLFVTVSLDGEPATHDRLRGVEGNHAAASETYRLLREAGIPALFGITLGAENAGFVRRGFAAYAERMKAVTFVHGGGIYGKPNVVDDAILLKSLRRVLRHYRIASPGELIEKLYLLLALRFFKQGRKANVIPCDVLRGSIHVTPQGDLRPCMFLPPVGNIKQSRYRELLASGTAKELRHRIAQGDCPHCWMNCYAPHSIMASPGRALALAGLAIAENATQACRRRMRRLMMKCRKAFTPSGI